MMQFPAAISERSKYPSTKPGAVGFERSKGCWGRFKATFLLSAPSSDYLIKMPAQFQLKRLPAALANEPHMVIARRADCWGE
jgi:hypothetical protein